MRSVRRKLLRLILTNPEQSVADPEALIISDPWSPHKFNSIVSQLEERALDQRPSRLIRHQGINELFSFERQTTSIDREG